jgi:hypothetical protein
VVTVITAFAPKPPPRFIVNSRMMPYAAAAGDVMASIAPHEMKMAYRESLAQLRQLWDRMNLPKQEKLKRDAI